MRRTALLLLPMALAFGCTLNTDYFSEYRGKNLLEAWDFDSLKSDNVTPKWALEPFADYADNTKTSYIASYTPTDYLLWENVGTAGHVADTTAGTPTVGPDGTSPAYRLEVKNLLVNGDFEDNTDIPWATVLDGVGSAGAWSTNVDAKLTWGTGPFANSKAPPVSFAAIENHSMFLTASPGGSNSNEVATLTFDTTSVPLLERKGGYRFRFDFRNATVGNSTLDVLVGGSSPAIESAELLGTWSLSGLAFDTAAQSKIYNLSRVYSLSGVPGDTAAIEVGKSGQKDEAVIDNVRVIQNDVPPYVTTSFGSLKSGGLALLPGTKPGAYQFSIYVRDDPTADQADSPAGSHVLNRFDAAGLTLQITGAVKEGSSTGLFRRFVARPSGGWTTWTKLTFKMGFDFVDFDADIAAGAKALVIELSPTNTVDNSTGGRDAGSLLVAQPTFSYNP